MELKKIGSNVRQGTTAKGAQVLVSYDTPVAAMLPDHTYIRTERKWSVTTSRHINKWLGGATAKEVPQQVLYDLANE